MHTKQPGIILGGEKRGHNGIIINLSHGSVQPNTVGHVFFNSLKMMIRVSCKFCDKNYKVPESAVGKKGKCSECGNIMVVLKPQSNKESFIEDLNIYHHYEVGSAVEKEKLLGVWKGNNSTKIKAVKIDRPWRLLWIACGGDLSFFVVNVQKKGKSTTLCRPVNVHNIGNTKQGGVDINRVGSLDLKVEVGGPVQVRWLIAVESLFS